MITPDGGPVFLDSETCGLYGMPVILQYKQRDDPDVTIHEFWRTPVGDSLELLETIANHPEGIIGFNLVFDVFHICKCYTTFLLFAEKFGYDMYPEDHIDDIAVLEAEARDGFCWKPVTACDLMLVARKGKYQSTMDRGDIRIRRVPTSLAQKLATELEHRVPIKDIYFARRSDKFAPKWKVYDITDEDGDIITDFKDVVLNFAPSSALKALVCDALGIEPDHILLFTDVAVDKVFNPVEYGYAPFATAVGSPGLWAGAWPAVIEKHISHWAFYELARKYAKKDVEYLPQLYDYFGSPEMGDDDSTLACAVAAIRWHGYALDLDGIRELKKKALIVSAKTPTAPGPARKYIEAVLDPTEKTVLKGSTKKVILEKIANDPLWKEMPCPACNATGVVNFGDFSVPDHIDVAISDDEAYADYDDSPVATLVAPLRDTCEVCDGVKTIQHPASVRAQEVLDARAADKEIELYDKLLRAGRFHASFRIIGTLSGRMAGADLLNPQGVKKTKEVRRQFPLAPPGYVLCLGDFVSFEVVIADCVYDDPDLRAELQTKNICTGCKGAKVDEQGNPCGDCDPPGSGLCNQTIHAIFGTFVYPPMTYVDILNTKGTKVDLYTRSKSAVFAMLYGGEGFTLMSRLGVPIEIANKAYQMFTGKFKKVGSERRKVFDMFCSMKQPNGFGTKVEWHEPAEFIESIFGFRRYFTLENMICKALFDLAERPPKTWLEIKAKVVRRDRKQTASGATRSALFGAAFQVQAGNMRAGANHVIQSAGAYITKRLQRNIWNLQPAGVHKFVVMPMNVHDEVISPALPEYVEKQQAVVDATVEEFRPRVPLIAIDWGNNLQTWADK